MDLTYNILKNYESEVLPLLKEQNINAYLMHLDDIETAKTMIEEYSNIHIPETK